MVGGYQISGNEDYKFTLWATEVVNSLYYSRNSFKDLEASNLEPYILDYVTISPNLNSEDYTNEIQ